MIYNSWDIECDRLKLVIIGHFLPFFLPIPSPNFLKIQKIIAWDIIILYQKSWSYDAWFLKAQQIEFGPVLSFDSLNKQPEKSKFWKNESNDHMIYGSWDMKCDWHNIFSFWARFCPFTRLTTWKIKIFAFSTI